jgi:probable selenate reductase FAD-binding subunit
MWNLREIHRPDDLSVALELLRRPHVRTVPLAGGTELIGRRDRTVEAVVDLRDLGLDTIEAEGDVVRMGAMTTLQEMATSPLLRGLADGLLARTAHSSAASLIRNMATLGGTLIAAADTADLPPALLALDARVTIRTPDEQHLSLADFYAAGGGVEGGLLTEVVIPVPPRGTGVAFHKVGRTPADQAIVSVAVLVTVEGGLCRKVRLAVGGIGPKPARVAEAEKLLEGQELTEARLEEAVQVVKTCLEPQSDFLASAEYRREMAGVLTRRALREAWERARSAVS